MKTKLFKSTLSLLLAVLLCVSVFAPTAFAATNADIAAVGDGETIPEVLLHATGGDPPKATIGRADVEKIFADLNLGEGNYYGIKQTGASGNPTNVSGSNASANVNAGSYTVYRTATTSGSFIKTPVWDEGTSQEINVRLYYTASFAVSGNDDGAIYLDGEEVSGDVDLYTDTEYTVTAKAVEDYAYAISGAPDGEAFAPTADTTVTATYFPSAHATVNVNMTGEGTVKILVEGEEIGDILPVGASFEVEATPNTDRGYASGSFVVTKNGEELEGIVYGPAADGDVFEVNATFTFDPEVVNYEVNAASPKLKGSDFNRMFNETGNRSYGYASIDDPTAITAINLNNGTNFTAGEYYIYSAPYSRNNPDWSVAKVKKLILRSYYVANFTVTGCEDGEVYVNNLPVEDNTAKLYTDAEYTITAKAVDAYFYVMTGAEDGVAFTPTSELNVKVAYSKEAHATFTVAVNGEGAATVKSDGEVVAEMVNEGSTFTVEATPNTNRGYKLDSIVVTKDGEEVEANEGAYGPVVDGEAYVITVNFKFEPDEVTYDLHADAKLTSTIVCGLFGDSILNLLTKSYGFASAQTPEQITALSTGGTEVTAGEYYIYKSNSSSDWSNARVLKLTIRTYYNGSFTVTGHADGEVDLNGEAVSGKVKLYTDAAYTVTVKAVEDYDYTIEGVTEGAEFTPTEDVNVTVTYTKPAYATFTLNVGEGGTATVRSGEYEVTDRINEGNTFTVEAHPSVGRGYQLESIVVTKDGEAVEAVEGAYGPVADGESYVITVSFRFEPKEVSYDLHADKNLTSSIVCSLFGDSILNLLTKSYGFASVQTPKQVTALSTSGTAVEAGEYYIYKSSSSSDWSNANVLKLTIRTYYTGTFTVSGHEEGEVTLNGEAVTGTKKLYTDEAYTIAAKPIEGYICSLYGAEDGVEFTPTADVEATVVYVKDAYATFTVNAGEGGSVKVMADGNEMVDKIPEGSAFTVTANANKGNGYYVESIVVTKDGEEVEANEGAYGPVAEGESYEITVTFGKAVLTLHDGEVSLTDIYYQNYEAVEQEILANAELVPEEFIDNAQVKIEYVAYTLLGYDIYASLNYQGDSAHPFGTSERGGTLKGGNTEKVRMTVTLPDYGIELRATATMTVSEDRVETAIESSVESFTITYGDDLKAAVFDTLSVYCVADDQPLEFTEEDITLTPATLNASLTSATTAQEVTVRYNGGDIYATAETTIDVFVRRAPSALDAENETITYGETPAAKVVTTPENLDHLKVIAGIDGDAEGFVSILIPESVKERMQIKIAGVVVLDIYQMLLSYIGEDGATLDELRELVNELYSLIDSSELIRQAIESSGFNLEVLDSVMRFINRLPNFNSNMRIRLEQVPKNAGTYLLFAISTDVNYETSEDVAYIVIKPKSSAEDETVELRFKAEMQTDGDNLFLPYEEAESFAFGGDLYVNDELTATDSLRTLYVGTTAAGNVISQSEPVREPGVYTETVFMLGGNYSATPIIREYTISRTESRLMMDDLTVPYDGKAHTTVPYFEDGADLTDSVSLVYIGVGYLSRRAPVDAGEYRVYATFSGDESHKATTALAKLTIEKLDAVITVTCKEEFTYGEIDRSSISDAEVGYTVTGTLEGENLGIILPSLTLGDNFPNVGEYTATVRFVQTNNNYNVTIENATLKIVPKKIVVAIDSAEKVVGDPDPDFTYTVTDTDGKVMNLAPDMKLAREEGEEAGEYRIYIAAFNETNYALDEEASTKGILTIKKPAYILGDTTGDGTVTIEDVTAIQRHIAEVDFLTGAQLLAADVDGNGKVDINDATAIQLYLAEYEQDYPIGQPVL